MPIVKCEVCRKEVFKTQYAIDRAKHNFCSVKCSNKFKCKPNIIVDKGTHAEIVLDRDNKEIRVLISKEDIKKVNQIKWNLKYDETIDNYYIYGHNRDVKESERKTYSLHRYLFDLPKDMEIDHINRNPLDNRRENLRCVSANVNKNNKGFYSNNKTGYKYIHYHSVENRYVCEIKRYKKIVFRKSSKDLNTLVQLRDKFMEENKHLWVSN